jgi:signal transduction histidine kinase
MPNLDGLHLSILRDITEQWVAEEALTETNKRLQEANKELERSNAELSYFAHAVGHDLGAPLRTIGLFSELMRRKASPDDEVDEYASEIKSAIHGINTFLEDLLAFAQVGRGGRSLRPVNSEAVLQFSLANLRAAIDESGAVIRHDPLPKVHADERQLAQLFQNLVSNSLKYRGESPPRIHIKADASGDEWLFSISDNGVGIPPDRQTMIFEMFKRLHGREIPGTGLGLALCKRIVENYGGRIWVESEPGRGSIFWFTVPAA